jgi:D-sedoheptulose 7-phosphate isomerase
VDFLERARALGSKLIVGINSDASVRAIKGSDRPIQGQEERRAVLAGLRSVDEVVIFEEPTPEELIKHIKPDVLVKGGDWAVDKIIGADFVTTNGGEVHSLPLKDGYSSSGMIEKIRGDGAKIKRTANNIISSSLDEHQAVISTLLSGNQDAIVRCGELIIDTFAKGGKVLLAGNGGSAADAQHIAAEFVGRYETERTALPAIALTTDTSALTALANDYDFERIFARQVDALASSGDCLIAISTSGTSANILSAVMAARAKGCRVVGMTGANGKKLAGLSDACILVPSERTSRIQEAHITIAHIWCEMVDRAIASG